MSGLSSVLGIRVAKAFLSDLTTGETKGFQFNPSELEEEAAVNYAMHESPGLSHKRPQAVSCENMVWRFMAMFDQIYYEVGKPGPPPPVDGSALVQADLEDQGRPSEVEDWRKFFLSLTAMRRVPAGGMNRIAAASPTPVHFEWPGIVSATVRVKTGKFKHTMFASGTARPRIFTIDVTLFEDPAERIYADDVRKNGTVRAWAAGSPSSHGSRNSRTV